MIGESPLRLLISTALNGWVELREGRYVPHQIAGQLAEPSIRRVGDWAGKLVADGEGESFVLEPDGWHLIDASSPVPLPEVARQKELPQSALHLASDGKLFAVFRDQPDGWSDERAHLLVTAVCAAGGCRSLGQQTTKLAPNDTFLTPDAALWAIDERGLWSFREGRWSVVLGGSAPGSSLGPGVHVVFTKTQPWFLAGRDGAKLFWPGDRQTAPHLAEVTGIGGMEQDPPDYDVVECAGRIYVASADKVCALDDKGRCAPLAIKGIQWPRRLGCDRRDRLWLGGYGVWRREGDVAIPVHELDGFIGNRETLALGRDSGAGLAIVIQNRGVAVLDPAQPTPPSPTRDLDEGDRPRGDHVRQSVGLWIDLDKPWPLLEELDITLRSTGAGGYGGVRDTGYRGPHFFEFFGRDARRLVEIIRSRVEREGRLSLLLRRDGEIGAPVTRIEIRPPAPSSPAAGPPDAASSER